MLLNVKNLECVLFYYYQLLQTCLWGIYVFVVVYPSDRETMVRFIGMSEVCGMSLHKVCPRCVSEVNSTLLNLSLSLELTMQMRKYVLHPIRQISP